MILRHLNLRYYSGRSLSVTTPIFYVNSRPHIGHAHSMVLADAICRWQATKSSTMSAGSLFTGTDEHGQKVYQAAHTHGYAPQEWVDKMSTSFRELACSLGCSVHRFIRTTELSHRQVVQHLWRQLLASGDIYLGVHSGWYCVSDETFYPEHETLSDGAGRRTSKTGHKPLEWVEEPNYIFRLSRYRERIMQWLRSMPSPIVPPSRANDLWAYLEDDGSSFRDLSVSRRRGPNSWGIPVPDDPTQYIYVWLDALANYLTVTGYPTRAETPNVHVIGKDILKFHAIYWPAFLMAAKLPLPQQILVHGHWTVNREKVSKSAGNGIDPMDLLERYEGADALRYYLMREARPASDTDFSLTSLMSIVNGDLVNQLGNLLSRALTERFVTIAGACSWPRPAQPVIINLVREACDRCAQAYEEHNFGAGLEHLLPILRLANARFSKVAPWRSTGVTDEELAQLLADVAHCCLVYSVMAYPVIPALAKSVWTMLLPEGSSSLSIPPLTFEGIMREDGIPLLDLPNKARMLCNQPILPRLK